MVRRLTFGLLGLGTLGLLLLILAQSTFVSASTLSSPAQTIAAESTLIARTVQSVSVNAKSSATALKVHIEGTATVIKQNVIGTATALKQKIVGTVDTVKTDIAGTITAYAPTINALETGIPGTVTALAATVTAVPSNIAGTATAYGSTLTAIRSTLALTKIPSDQASTTLTNYTLQTYGSAPTFTSAGGADFNLAGTYPIPGQIINAQSLATNLTVQVYKGQTANGTVWLAYGTGTVTNPTTNNTTNVQRASLGIYSQAVQSSATLDTNSALALAKSTYPTLAGFTYSPVAVKQGYGFYANSYTYTVNPNTNQLTLTPESVFLDVVAGSNGQIVVTAAVGTGVYSTTLHP